MKKIFLILLGSLVALTAWSQVSFSDLDPTELDKAGAKVLLDHVGPLHIGTVVLKDGKSYAAGFRLQDPSMADVFRNVDLSQVKVDGAKISIAGPDKIYLSNLEYMGSKYSVLFVGNKTPEYAILEYYKGSEDLASYWNLLDTSKAQVAFKGKDSATISNIMIGSGVYTLNVTFGYDFKAKSATYKKTGTVAKAEDPAAIAAKYEATIAELEGKLKTADEAKNAMDLLYQGELLKVEAKDKEIQDLKQQLVDCMSSAPMAASASALDDIIVAQKISASKLDISGTTVKVAKGIITLENVKYAGKPYSCTVVNNNTSRIARITQVYDGSNKPLLKAPVDFGWGQFQVVAYAYQELMAMIKILKKQVAAGSDEIAALQKERDALKAQLEMMPKGVDTALDDMIIGQKLKEDNFDISKTNLSEDGTGTITITNLYYANNPYKVILNIDDMAKTGQITQIIDKSNRSLLRTPINFGWGQLKVMNFGFRELVATIKTIRGKMGAPEMAKMAVPLLDSVILKNKLQASKVDFTKAVLTQKDGSYMVKNVTYAGNPYTGVIDIDNKGRIIKISQVYDANKTAMLSNPIPIGWGEFQIGSVVYQQLMGIIRTLRKYGMTDSGDKIVELEAAMKDKDGKISGLSARLKEIEDQKKALLDLALSIDPDKLDISQAIAKKVDNRISISKLIYNGRTYGAMIRFDDKRKIANLVEVWDPVNKVKPVVGPIDLGWVQFKMAEVGYMKLRVILDTVRAALKTEKEKVAKLEADLAKALKREAPPLTEYAKELLTGLEGGADLMGTWKMAGEVLTQTETKLFFAKRGFAVAQAGDLLYGIKAKGANVPKEGYGLHILASGLEEGSKKGKGYGYGDSYLVWVTRDDYYKNFEKGATYVMLYDSKKGSMKEIGSVRISESITEELDIQVQYTSGKIAVYVNGTERLSYTIPDAGRMMGTEVALRTMQGPIQFTDLYVRTK